MAHITEDRVLDTSTTTGTGAITVSGTPPSGYRTFSSVCSTSDEFFYCITHQSADEWEVGLGTYSGTNQITRTSVLESSNAGAAVNFSAGDKDVFITLPGSRSPIKRFGGLTAYSSLPTAKTFYVATTGDDNNDGLSSSTPFATVTKAIDEASFIIIDEGGAPYVSIEIADGTYDGTAVIGAQAGLSGYIYMYSASFDASAVVLDMGSSFFDNYSAYAYIYGITFKTSSTFAIAGSRYKASTDFYYCVFEGTGNPAQQALVQYSASANFIDCEFKGDAQRLCKADAQSTAYFSGATTITGSPSYSAAALVAGVGSVIDWSPSGVTGSATGARWSHDESSFITGSLAIIPGDADGARLRREKLNANRTYYVRADGSDSNTGTANTSGDAWATLQHAWDWITSNIDQGAYTVKIKIADGTYSGFGALAPHTGKIQIEGNTTTPANVVVQTDYSTPGGRVGIWVNTSPGVIELAGITWQRGQNGDTPIYLSSKATVIITGAMKFDGNGYSGGYVVSIYGGGVFFQIDYGVAVEIIGAWSTILSVYGGGQVGFGPALTLTTVSFSLFADFDLTATMEWYPASITGTATGTRYSVTANSVINTYGGGASALPGNAAGSTSGGGQYL